MGHVCVLLKAPGWPREEEVVLLRTGRLLTLLLAKTDPLPPVLSQVARVAEKPCALAMKTLRARFKKTEVSLRPLSCMPYPNLRRLSPKPG